MRIAIIGNSGSGKSTLARQLSAVHTLISLEYGPAVPLPDRVAMLLDSPVAAKRMLSSFYSTDRLMSSDARARWVEPNLAPLAIATILENHVHNHAP